MRSAGGRPPSACHQRLTPNRGRKHWGSGGGGTEGGTETSTPSTSALGGRVYVPPTGGALCLRRLITRILISVRKQLVLPSCDARVPVADRTSMLREEADQNSPIPVLGFRLQLVCFVVIGPQRGPDVDSAGRVIAWLFFFPADKTK